MISITDQLILLIKARLTIRMLRTVDQLIILSMEDLIIYIDPELDTFYSSYLTYQLSLYTALAIRLTCYPNQPLINHPLCLELTDIPTRPNTPLI